MKILLKENYFENPNLIRRIGLSMKNYTVNNTLSYPHMGWRGQRTEELHKLNDEFLNKISQNIFNLCYEYFNLDNFIYPHNKIKPKDLNIATYFHINTENCKKSFPDFYQDKFHKDFGAAVTGVVYLTPNAPTNSGTSILDGENNKIVNIENKYNRLIAFESSRIHSPSDFFGTNTENGRMTFNFFILESDLINCKKGLSSTVG